MSDCETLKNICTEQLQVMNDAAYREAAKEYFENPYLLYASMTLGPFNGLVKRIVIRPSEDEVKRLTDPPIEFINRTMITIQDLFLAELAMTFSDDPDLWEKGPEVKNIKEIVSGAFRKFDAIRFSGNYEFSEDPYACLFIVSECVKGYAKELWKSMI